MHQRLLLPVLVLGQLFNYLSAQEINSSRITNWSSPGCQSFFSTENSISLADFGADESGVNASDESLLLAIEYLNGPGEIFIPRGTYLFHNTIVLPDSIILRGEIDDDAKNPLTTLKLSPANNQHGILIVGNEEPAIYSMSYELRQGQQKLYVTKPDLFAAGDIIRIVPFDDTLLVNNAWAYSSTGQIVRITAIDGDSLFLNKPLRRNYTGNKLPELRKQTPRNQVHLQCLRIERNNETTSQSSNIYMFNASDCSITGIESIMTNFAHIDVLYSSGITIENNFISDAFSHGSGGKGYGIMLQSTTGDCFIHQNNFHHLRHSMILQSGANGNVLAYNYSVDPFWSGTFLPANSAGDLVLHGNYPYMNLMEGNIVQNIVIDNSHGINGPFNTFYRNKAELYGLFMNTSPASDKQNFIGNQVTNTTSPFLGLYALQGSNHFEYGNMIRGIFKPDATDEPKDTSMFNYFFPSFYDVVGNVPPVVSANWQSPLSLIEAQYRYTVSEQKAICDEIVYHSTAIDESNSISAKQFDIYPNPFHENIYINKISGNSDYNIKIFDSLGRLVYSAIESASGYVDTSLFNDGFYVLIIEGSQAFNFKLIKN